MVSSHEDVENFVNCIWKWAPFYGPFCTGWIVWNSYCDTVNFLHVTFKRLLWVTLILTFFFILLIGPLFIHDYLSSRIYIKTTLWNSTLLENQWSTFYWVQKNQPPNHSIKSPNVAHVDSETQTDVDHSAARDVHSAAPARKIVSSWSHFTLRVPSGTSKGPHSTSILGAGTPLFAIMGAYPEKLPSVTVTLPSCHTPDCFTESGDLWG